MVIIFFVPYGEYFFEVAVILLGNGYRLFNIAGNVRALRSVGDFINVAPGDESPIEKLKYKICTEAK